MSKIAVLIPCYNESQTIAKVVRDYRQGKGNVIRTMFRDTSSNIPNISCSKKPSRATLHSVRKILA